MNIFHNSSSLLKLYSLAFYGPFSYNELKRFLDSISFKILISNLKELEDSGLIIRKEYQEIPPNVYLLSFNCFLKIVLNISLTKGPA